MWGTVFGDWAELHDRRGKNSDNDPVLGYHARGGGSLLGADYSFTNQCLIGMSGAYSYSDVHVNQSRAHGRINSYYGALYAMLSSAIEFLDLAVIGGYDQFQASRTIEFGVNALHFINRRVRTNHAGWDINGHVDGGLILEAKKVQMRPFLAFDYLFIRENAYQEHGAQSLNLQVLASKNTVLRGEAGLNLSRCYYVSYGKWIPQARASAVREVFCSNGSFYQSNFIGQSGFFTVKNKTPNRTLFSPGAGVSGLFCKDRFTISLDYNGKFCSRYHNQVGKAEFSWMF